MNIHLVVVKPFAGFARGDVITDLGRVQEVLRSERASYVVRIAAPSQKEG
jgi:hypothetical protein